MGRAGAGAGASYMRAATGDEEAETGRIGPGAVSVSVLHSATDTPVDSSALALGGAEAAAGKAGEMAVRVGSRPVTGARAGNPRRVTDLTALATH